MDSTNNKLLYIDAEHHAFFDRNGAMASILAIEPDDILSMVQTIAEDPNAEMDECTSENDIVDQIEKTIYSELYKKLKDLQDNREVYLQEIENDYSEYERKMGIS